MSTTFEKFHFHKRLWKLDVSGSNERQKASTSLKSPKSSNILEEPIGILKEYFLIKENFLIPKILKKRW